MSIDLAIIEPIRELCTTCDELLSLQSTPADPYVKLNEIFQQSLKAAQIGDFYALQEKLLWIKNYAYRLVIEAPVNDDHWRNLLRLISSLNDATSQLE